MLHIIELKVLYRVKLRLGQNESLGFKIYHDRIIEND